MAHLYTSGKREILLGIWLLGPFKRLYHHPSIKKQLQVLWSTCMGVRSNLSFCATNTWLYMVGSALNFMVFPVLIFLCIHLVNTIKFGGQDEF